MMRDIPGTMYCFSIIAYFMIPYIAANHMQILNDGQMKTIPEHLSQHSNDTKALDNISGCELEEFDIGEVVFLNNTDIFLRNQNATLHYSDYHIKDGKVYACLKVHQNSKNELIVNCKSQFVYDSHEFDLLPNESILLYGELFEPGEYKLKGSQVLVCASDYDSEDWDGKNSTSSGLTLSQASIYVGKIGSGISIVALTIHLLTFCSIPTLRNLPGYNLASLSVAFLFAYSFVLIGQIPEVLGLFCVVSGILQQNFFLVAFFCMNILAFDVWRTLRRATKKLMVGSNCVRKRQFIWYSMYAWGCPMVISTISVLFDNLESVPEKYRPFFGRGDTCWMTNDVAKIIFFAVPAFTLFCINGIFFISSSFIIYCNSMKYTNDQQNQTVKLNYVLYLRLGLMMGVTWTMGVIAMIWKNEIVWFIHDLFNSLQGLFLFLFFTCTRKVIKYIRGKATLHNISTSTSEKGNSTVSTKSDTQK